MRVHLPAFVLGSVAPDLPLFLLTGWFFLVPRRQAGEDDLFGSLYDQYFFHHPVWIASHNFLHAPFILLGLAVLGRYALKRGRSWGFGLLWFTAGCALHSLIDIFTHHNDGPLLLFPFDWSLRFEGPISYWHPDYYGHIFLPLEMSLNVLILAYFGGRWWRKRRRATVAASME